MDFEALRAIAAEFETEIFVGDRVARVRNGELILETEALVVYVSPDAIGLRHGDGRDRSHKRATFAARYARVFE